MPVLALSQLQSFKLSHWTAFHVVLWGAFGLFLLCAIGIVVVLSISDPDDPLASRPKRFVVGAWALGIFGTTCLIAGSQMLFVPIAFDDVYNYKTSDIVEITPLTTDYKIKLKSGQTLWLDRGRVNIHHTSNRFSYGQCQYQERRSDVTEQQAAVFDHHADDLVDRLARDTVLHNKADLYLTTHDTHRILDQKHQQPMTIKH